jgi:pantoate ligase/cytidylate kinase
MRLFRTIEGLSCYLQTITPGFSVGFVPTMGALHDGHLSLIRRARQDNDVVVVSIFVNPLQFGPGEDLHRYPENFTQDQELCDQNGVDALFAPSVAELGLGDQPLTGVVPPESMVQVLCGPGRPGHFQGVATIVTKLLNIVRPDYLYLGQKDAQQLAIIRRLVRDLNFPVTIVPCPIVREASGLAMSSRNQYLSPTERQTASGIYHALQKAVHQFRSGERNSSTLIQITKAALLALPGFSTEYVEITHPDTLVPLEKIEDIALLAVAGQLGTTRLIDNVLLRDRLPIIAIDGPAGVGKSTVTRQVARSLGLTYLDTGAMYRAITWLVLHRNIPATDAPAIAELVSQAEIELNPGSDQLQVKIDGQDLTQEIRTPEVSALVSTIAAQPAVRRQLVARQQHLGRRGAVVAEGRDIANRVFPDAELKIFLTASLQERAQRRLQDLAQQGKSDLDLPSLVQSLAERDHQDQSRSFSPFVKVADAIEINTDHLSIDAVVSKIIDLYKSYCSPQNQPLVG